MDKREREKIKEVLYKRFSLNELKELLFDYQVDYEGFQGHKDEKSIFVMEMVSYFERRGWLDSLKSSIAQKRPDVFINSNLPDEPIRKIIFGQQEGINPNIHIVFGDLDSFDQNN